IRLAFDLPIQVVGQGRQLSVSPGALGAVAYVKEAIAEARRASPHTAVRLPVHLQGPLVASYVASLAKQLEKPASDASVVLSGFRHRVRKGTPGWALDRKRTMRALAPPLPADPPSPFPLPPPHPN